MSLLKKYYKKIFIFYIPTKTICLMSLFITMINNTMDNNYNRERIANYCFDLFLENTPVQLPADANFDSYQKKRLYDQIKKDINPSKKQKTDTSNPTNSSQLKAHIHINKKPYICYECQIAFKYRENLKQHLIINHGTKNHIINHTKINTSKEKPFKCLYKECHKTFTTKSALTKHEKIHTNDKKFCCTYCFKSFITHYALMTHMRIHTGEKISCSKCSKTYTTNSSLNKHYNECHKNKSTIIVLPEKQ